MTSSGYIASNEGEGDLSGNSGPSCSYWETLTNHFIRCSVNTNSRSADGMAVTQHIQSCVDGKDDLLEFKLGTVMRKTDKLTVQCIKFGLIYESTFD